MNFNTYEISKKVTFEYCQIPLLKEHPSIIQDVKKYIDVLILKISDELKKTNKTLKQFLDEESFENIDIEDILYNIIIVLHGGAIDNFMKYEDVVADRFYEYYLNSFDVEIGEYIISLLREINQE